MMCLLALFAVKGEAFFSMMATSSRFVLLGSFGFTSRSTRLLPVMRRSMRISRYLCLPSPYTTLLILSQFFRDRFTVFDRILGKGTYGAVYLAQEKATLVQMACKVVNLSACGDKHMERRTYAKAGDLYQDQCRRAAEGRKIALREIKILSRLSHVSSHPFLLPNPYLYILAAHHKP